MPWEGSLILRGSQRASLTRQPQHETLPFLKCSEPRKKEVMHNNLKLLRFLFETYG